ncbi:MAG: arginine--tRNA ligase [Pseudomonadota bacterium]|nr:arginine--tRNA ligase [Pseudomonadota bacterium]
MKNEIQKIIQQALDQLKSETLLPSDLDIVAMVERTRDSAHGDFASNVAMVLCKQAKSNPRDLAGKIIAALPDSPLIDKVEIAGPGFINFYLAASIGFQVVPQILQQGDAFGRSDAGGGKKVQVEFVSANPTGPLHVGHGRGAAIGATVANLLQAIGYDVHSEYYVNDAGRQMDILAASVWLRYLELAGEELTFPTNGYKGDYVWDIAAALHREHGDEYRHPTATVFEAVCADEPAGGDKEAHIDALILKAKILLGSNDYEIVFQRALRVILDDIRDDLEKFGITYQSWFSERSLVESGAVSRAIEQLQQGGHIYEKDGALWFRSSDFGDEKDRVVVRDNGQTTYFASDIAYHMEKFERGFERVIDVWGADHHGYVPRIKGSLQALGRDPEHLEVILVQFANLYRGGEKVQMSTRSGEFVTIRQLRKEVGRDAARFFYVMRKAEQHLDFDLELAKSHSSDNPVYYVQYAHARICAVLRQAQEKQLDVTPTEGGENLELLTASHEQTLLTTLSRYPEVVHAAAMKHEPHQLCHYMRDLANDFHTYYNAHPFLIDDDALRDARIKLIVSTRQVLKNGLALLGVSSPESM